MDLRRLLEPRRLLILILVFPILVLILLSIVFTLRIVELKDFLTINLGDVMVALGTILLAFFTAELAMSATEDAKAYRRVMIDEARRERRRLRIREQLYGLYSPLMAHVTLFSKEDYEHRKEKMIDPFMEKYLIKSNYQFLASDRMKDLLIQYFDTTPANIRQDTGSWEELMDQLRNTVSEDFHNLSEEYRNLTNPVS